MVVNCRSVRNKIADLAVVINEYKPDIVLGNESWLKSDINSSEIFPENYKVYRKDRDNNSRGGGVFQAVKNDLIVTHRSEWDSDCEIIWTQCQLAGIRSAKSIYFGSYYRPNISDTESLEELNTSLLKMGAALHTPGIFECKIASLPVRKCSGYSAKKCNNLSLHQVFFVIDSKWRTILFARNCKLQ